jgi:hypothetical protein
MGIRIDLVISISSSHRLPTFREEKEGWGRLNPRPDKIILLRISIFGFYFSRKNV